jgi:hypothetical protein
MALEWRGNNRYYYEKTWQSGRVVSRYIGGGDIATLFADSQHLINAQRAEQLEEQRTLRAEQGERVRLVCQSASQMRALTAAVLIANGYHQHKRQWRKRMGDMIIERAPALPVPIDEAAQRKEGMDALRTALRMRAEPKRPGGKVTAVQEAEIEQQKQHEVRRVLREYPVIWSHLRDVLSDAEMRLIEATCGGRETTTAMLVDRLLQGMRRDLGYDAAPILEKLLIEQIVLCWLDLDMVQQLYATNAHREHTYRAGLYWDRRVNGAQQRYHRAIEALARVRRLATPVPWAAGQRRWAITKTNG